MYGRKRLGDISLPVFNDAGEMVTDTLMVPASQMAITPVMATTGAAPANAAVSYTGDGDVDRATEAGMDTAPTGNKMLLWLAVGGIALFVLFGKDLLRSR